MKFRADQHQLNITNIVRINRAQVGGHGFEVHGLFWLWRRSVASWRAAGFSYAAANCILRALIACLTLRREAAVFLRLRVAPPRAPLIFAPRVTRASACDSVILSCKWPFISPCVILTAYIVNGGFFVGRGPGLVRYSERERF